MKALTKHPIGIRSKPSF